MKKNNPRFIFIIGNRGSGKSRLAEQIISNLGDDAVLIAADEVHSEVLGFDEAVRQVSEKGRIDFPKEVQSEGTKIVNKLLLGSIDKQKNIVLDASFGQNHFKFMEQLKNIGYSIEVHGLIIDKYLAAYNVEKRTLDFFDLCMDVKNGIKPKPTKFNAIDVGYKVPLMTDDKIVEIIDNVEKHGVDLFLYEYGKNIPSYVSGKNSEGAVEFYKSKQSADYCLLHLNLLKLNQRCQKYGRDIAPLVFMVGKEVTIKGAEMALRAPNFDKYMESVFFEDASKENIKNKFVPRKLGMPAKLKVKIGRGKRYGR
ncbi:MAG: hypothetical protein E7012_02340 [Alphaproteobacteria bacterium]|nr:hypothetical protein [Alphaproteobacteria bacterium]